MELNTVNQGDCLELMKEIADQSINLILTDLPYQVTSCKWDSALPFDNLWREWKRVLKPDGVVLLTASGRFVYDCMNSNPGWYRYQWIWIKNVQTNFANCRKAPMRRHESVLVFYPTQPTYNPQGVVELAKPRKKHKTESTIGEQFVRKSLTLPHYQTHTGYPSDLLYFNLDKERFHPTAKPVALFEYLVRTYTNEGDTVLDPCAGAGSSGVACLNSARNFILIEKESKYVEIANHRLNLPKN